MTERKLSGKVALITGAAAKKGIGAATAQRLAKDGAAVAVTDLTMSGRGQEGWEGLLSVVKTISDKGGQAMAAEMDVTNAAQVDEVVKAVIKRFGKIDILVNCAAAPAGRDRVPVTELEEEVFDLVQRVNMKGTFICCRAVARHLQERNEGGKIINISAGGGLKGFANVAAYSSSKFGIVGFTQCLAHELGPYGIQVNSVCPGAIENERLDDVVSAMIGEGADVSVLVDKLGIACPAGRLGKPSDIANAVAFLASDESSYITGQALGVCGGSVMVN